MLALYIYGNYLTWYNGFFLKRQNIIRILAITSWGMNVQFLSIGCLLYKTYDDQVSDSVLWEYCRYHEYYECRSNFKNCPTIKEINNYGLE